MAAEKKQPVHQYRLGKIVGSVWFNEDDNGSGTHTVQIARLYRLNDEDGWQRASSFYRDDLMLVAKVADHCHTWIHEIWKQERLYHTCSKCTSKWFSRTECNKCPRCGSTELSSTTAVPPWAGEPST